jgi:hypothetical protein
MIALKVVAIRTNEPGEYAPPNFLTHLARAEPGAEMNFSAIHESFSGGFRTHKKLICEQKRQLALDRVTDHVAIDRCKTVQQQFFDVQLD